jgi:crotonyl-CoA carboxylase/reductase
VADGAAKREVKDLYAVGEIPPDFHVPKNMHAWAIRRERQGRPLTAMQLEVVPTPEIASDEVLVLVMAAGVNYNGIWAGLGEPVSMFDVHKQPYHVAGSDASGIVWAVGSRVKRWKPRSAMAATRCSRRPSASGAMRRRTGRSRSSVACNRAS